MSETRKTKLLLVEDEAIIALSEQKTLEQAGFEVATVHSGERAVESATADTDISLILMDIDLGRGIDGTEAATRILEQRRVPIVFLTSHAEREVVERVKGITRYGYVVKNSGPFVLVESVHMGLELFEAHEQSRRHAERVQQLNRTYQVLSDVNQSIVRVESIPVLLDSICDIAVGKGDFRFAWMGTPQRESGEIAPVAMNGEDAGYVSALHIDLTDAVFRDHPVARAYRFGRVEVVDDIETAEGLAPWKDALEARGARSIAALPVRVQDEVRYVLALYAPTAGFFDEKELKLLDELVMDVGFAVEVRENDERREEAERRNREWQALIAYVIEHDPGAIAVLDTELRHIYVSKRFREDYGLSDADLIGRRHYDVFPEIPEKWREVHRRALAGEVLRSEDDHFVRLDGSVDYTRWECRPWYRTNDEIGGIVLYTEVITSMKTAEEDRRTVLGALESLLSNSPDLVSIVGADGRYWMVSDSVAETIGRAKDEIIGRTFEELLPAAVAAEFRRRVEEVAGSATELSTHDTIPSADGERTFRTTLFPSREVDGEVTMVGVMSVDVTETERMRAQLVESDRRWQYAVDSAGDGLWDWDATTDQVFFSSRWKTMLGYRDEEIGDTLEEWESRIHPEDQEQVFRLLEQHLNGETDEYRSEHRMRCRDGSYRWILDRGRVVRRDSSGAPLRVIGTHTDIDERRRLERELLLKDRAFETALAGIVLTDLNGIITYANDAAVRISGHGSREDVEGQSAGRFLRDEEELDALMRTVAGGTPVATELVGIRPDGEEYIMHIAASGVVDEEGTIQRLMASFVDRTEANRAEEALREREAVLHNVLQSASDGFVLTDEAGYIDEWNPAQERITGRAREESIGRPIWDVQSAHAPGQQQAGDTTDKIRESVQALLRTGRAPYLNKLIESELATTDGRTRNVETSIFSVATEHGYRVGSLLRDVTERRSKERKLRALVEEKDTLMQELNHRVKNNLAMITSLLSLKDNALGPGVDLSDVQNQVQAIGFIHEQLSHSDDVSTIAVGNYLRSVVDSALAFRPDIDVALDYVVEDLPLPTKRAVSLGLIANELMTNALKHAFAAEESPRARVLLETDSESGGYRFSISHNGTGLPEDIDTAGETSLGLRLVRALAQQLGAEMRIHRDPETTFELLIPPAG